MKYRVWCIVNPPNEPTFYPVRSPEAGARVIERLAENQLEIPEIWGNVFGLEVLVNEEREEWQDGEGRTVGILLSYAIRA